MTDIHERRRKLFEEIEKAHRNDVVNLMIILSALAIAGLSLLTVIA